MILDKLANLTKYNLNLEFIIEDLKKNEFNKGRYDIDGDEKFGIDLIYNTQEADKALWEAHRKYIDIHVIIEGEEFVSICDIENSKSTKEYEEDFELFEAVTEQQILLKKGYFLLLFPNEVHKTSILVDEPVSIKKKVYKLILK